jgi:hypothetical protein
MDLIVSDVPWLFSGLPLTQRVLLSFAGRQTVAFAGKKDRVTFF